MCGVAGTYSYHYAAPAVDREELVRMRDYMQARGPDSAGLWCSLDDRVALAHRRLSIIDLSDNANQPMVSSDGNFVISFNGEIYNYRELRAALINKGHRFKSESDTEVILNLYAEKGISMLNDLRGMFAFALWDMRQNKMLLARDPYGIKPLYYADDGWTLRTASQVKSLLTSSRVSREREPAGIAGFYLFGSVPEPFTTYREIYSVPAGSYLWVDKTGPAEPVAYFSLAEIFTQARQDKIDHKGVEERIRAGLLDSIQQHMVSDVPVGAFLSAGIDSGALTGLMSEQQPKYPIQTITIAFKEFSGRHDDESILAEQVARHYGTEHTTRTVTEEEFRQDLPLIMEAMDQPSIDGINTWFVSKAAKEQGLKVAISGLGGDELFGGYPSFKDIPRWVRWLQIPSQIPYSGDLARGFYSLLFDTRRSTLSPKAAGLLKYGGTYPGAYLLRRGLFMPWELKALMGREMAREGLRRLRPIAHIEQSLTPRPRTPFGRVAALEASLYLRNQLLRDTDWASMAHSLEVRTPLVDARLLKALAPYLVTGETDGKRLLAGCAHPPLPREIVDRPKTGFGVPVGEWLQRVSDLDTWRQLPMLTRKNCHWARRLAYALQAPDLA